jgi:hypothetical protein
MDNAQLKQLCLKLMKADNEEDIINILKEAGYWDNQDVWRYYGDTENNYSTIGNQQSRPEAALVEKIVNSIDARLMNECFERKIDPESGKASQNIRDAVAAFFEENPEGYTAGLISEWTSSKRSEVARGITLTATGYKPREGSGRPCFSISDCGEGQTPEMMPFTLLSLDSENKQKIPFVQGKFNMGGTGALKFCGYNNLQLILTRRNPKISDGNITNETDHNWGFTIVRRENPTGGRRSSVYTYLAPIDSDTNSNKGKVLHFSAKSMPIFPEGNSAYKKHSEWGTMIKLYEYKATGFKSHILMPDGLLSRIDLLLPSLALPARFHECRDYRGHSGSPETTVTGLNVRLGDDKAANVEEDFPIGDLMNISGEKMSVTIYAFNKGKAGTYRKREGIIFTVNGQTHGHLTTDFFRRPATGCSYLKDSLLAVVDCGKLSGRAIEDLFMNSRDRLSGDELRVAIEDNLIDILKNNDRLRRLQYRRKQEQRDAKIEDSKPLKTVLTSMIKKSPTLTQLFIQGTRISNPYKTTNVQEQDEPYKGERYPTYFKFRNIDYGHILSRSCHINMRCRIIFETDVVNDYFGREIDRGEFNLYQIADNGNIPYNDFTLNMQNGLATLNLKLPSACNVNDKLQFEAQVTDRTKIEPFVNKFVLGVLEASERKPGDKSKRKKPPGKEKGQGRETPSGLELPAWTQVYEKPSEGQKGWQDMDPPFDRHSALRVKADIGGEEEFETDQSDVDHETYDFYINMDNIYLKNEQKKVQKNPDTMNACFLYGMILIGIALIHDEMQTRKQKDLDEEESGEFEGMHIEDKVENFTKAIAPVLLPMIDSLGGIETEFEDVQNFSG